MHLYKAGRTQQRPIVIRPMLVLMTCCLSVLVVGIDTTIVNIALPSIQYDLHATISGLQWVLDGYTLVIAGCLMLAGSLADRFGRRLIFLCGLGVFTFASLACAFAPNVQVLIASRALQGVGGSMLNPVALAIITTAFTEPRERAKALGVWGAVFGVSLALGPVLGGALTQTFGWRAVFLVNGPIGVVAMALVLCFIPEAKAREVRSIDKLGQVLFFLTITALSYGFIEGQHRGWRSSVILIAFISATCMFLIFVWHERRHHEPLVEFRYFRSVSFSGATITAGLAFAALASVLFLQALYLQNVRHFTALHAGLCLAPLAIAIVLCSPLSGRMISTFGARPSLMLAGLMLMAGALLSVHITEASSFPALISVYLCFGAGIGFVNPAISKIAMSGLPADRSGVAAAIASTSRQIGSALGVAISGAIVATRVAHGMAFVQASHPAWWSLLAVGVLIAAIGWFTETSWAQRSARLVHKVG